MAITSGDGPADEVVAPSAASVSVRMTSLPLLVQDDVVVEHLLGDPALTAEHLVADAVTDLDLVENLDAVDELADWHAASIAVLSATSLLQIQSDLERFIGVARRTQPGHRLEARGGKKNEWNELQAEFAKAKAYLLHDKGRCIAAPSLADRSCCERTCAACHFVRIVVLLGAFK